MNILNNGIKEIKDIAAETLWPTRCAICDKQGFLLCPNCASKLKFIDQNKTCEICGEPFGKIQCCSCNPIDKTLSEKEKLEFKLGFDKCLSVCFLNKETGRIVVLNKDAGERRLSYVMAYFISKAIPKNWLTNNTYLTYIPSSTDAYRRRGFDHSELLANNLSSMINTQKISCFKRPTSKDQRKLGRKEREQNLNNRFILKQEAKELINTYSPNFIIVDDVYTTGSTLNAASKCIKNFGCNNVYCVSFSRTF